jgi:16S rRNA (cytosine1402-N4)-methyltransferase
LVNKTNGMDEPVHLPVLTAAIVEYLQLAPGARCIDATIDGGGHTAALLEHTAPDGVVLGVDRDPELLTAVRRRLHAAVDAGRLLLASGNFRELTHIAAARHFTGVQAIVFDLGLSSFHLDVSGRGFSFMRHEPLDMRFDPNDPGAETAADFLNARSAAELAAVFRSFGEERFAGRIAAAIVVQRDRAPMRTTQQLFDVIAAALPGRVRWRAARSAARVFQALRIAVNDELNAVSDALPQALSLLAPGGRMAVLAFHSLEDRIVKQFFVAERQAGRVRILTKKPLRASDAEIAANPRAASAKLRVCERLATPLDARPEQMGATRSGRFQ